MKDKLGNPDVIVVNGLSSTCEIHDIDRITYLHDHLEYVLKAVRSGSNVCGYSGDKHNRNIVSPISH